MGGGGLAEKVRIGEEDFFAHGFSRMDTDFWVTCSGLFFLAIEPSSCLAISLSSYEEKERGSRLLNADFHGWKSVGRGLGCGLVSRKPGGWKM